MPDKPLWLARLPEAIGMLESAADSWVERSELEALLGIGRRRAQQLLSPVAGRRVGTSVLARREDLIAHLRRIASGEDAHYDERRRRRLWSELGRLRRRWIEQPPLLVEVPEESLRKLRRADLQGLPEGVELAPGRITVAFATPEEALEKLVALAVAIGRDRGAFDERVALPDASAQETLAV